MNIFDTAQMNIFDTAQWKQFESEQWHRAVRYRGLELRSLDADERVLVFDAITSDLEHRKRPSSPAPPECDAA